MNPVHPSQNSADSPMVETATHIPIELHPHVLVVEDNAYFREHMGLALQGLGIPLEITFCSTGQCALDHMEVSSMPWGLALIDLGLPDFSGIELIRCLRLRWPELPMLVISVLNTEQDVLEAIRAGARGYLLKSESIEASRNAIVEILQGHYPISPSLARFLFKLAETPGDEDAGPVVEACRDFQLTRREQETLNCFVQGFTYQQTAVSLGVSVSTIQSHVRHLYRKLGVHSQAQAISKVKHTGLLG